MRKFALSALALLALSAAAQAQVRYGTGYGHGYGYGYGRFSRVFVIGAPGVGYPLQAGTYGAPYYGSGCGTGVSLPGRVEVRLAPAAPVAAPAPPPLAAPDVQLFLQEAPAYVPGVNIFRDYYHAPRRFDLHRGFRGHRKVGKGKGEDQKADVCQRHRPAVTVG